MTCRNNIIIYYMTTQTYHMMVLYYDLIAILQHNAILVCYYIVISIHHHDLTYTCGNCLTLQSYIINLLNVTLHNHNDVSLPTYISKFKPSHVRTLDRCGALNFENLKLWQLVNNCKHNTYPISNHEQITTVKL